MPLLSTYANHYGRGGVRGSPARKAILLPATRADAALSLKTSRRSEHERPALHTEWCAIKSSHLRRVTNSHLVTERPALHTVVYLMKSCTIVLISNTHLDVVPV